ncbi:MAG: hypothetical protein K6F47_01680 [Bacteroidaceae bacterium]|nr:hypothetical protein [Bacteroidaceae bacterium]
MKQILFLFIFLSLANTGVYPAEKQKTPKEVKLATLYKAANLAIKNSSGQDNAKKNLMEAVNRQNLTFKDKANIYYTCALLDESSNSIQNTKAYLKQVCDTAALFSTLLNMYGNLYKCDSIDALPNAKGIVKLKYNSKTNSLRSKHLSNILNGGKYYLSKNNYAMAYNFFDSYHTYTSPSDANLAKVAYWATFSSYKLAQYNNTLKYIDQAFNAVGKNEGAILQEYKCRSHQALNNDSAYIKDLIDGVKKYPSHDFFFVNLADIYCEKHLYKEGLALADSLIKLDPEKPLYWFSKSRYMLAENDYEKCIEYSDSTIRRDSTYSDAYYNKGISYLNLALIRQDGACTNLLDPKCMEDKKAIETLYRKAQPCMEMVRKLEPENKERWGRHLYRIYMFLNRGKEFEEIDKLLRSN